MSEIEAGMVHRGHWINHSNGPVLGPTLTIESRWSNLVVAVLAILVSVAVNSVWSLVLFTVHQLRATSRPRPYIFRQQQVLFRTLGSPAAIMSDCIKLGIIHHKDKASHALRCAALAIVALIFVAGGLLAGIFSSYVISTTNVEVLVNGNSCREINVAAYVANASTSSATTIRKTLRGGAQSYYKQCYSADPVPTGCDFYVRPRIEFNTTGARCPFSSDFCMDGEVSIIVLDSGHVDSNDALGINAAAGDRVSLRRKTTCAPLNIDRHLYDVESSEPSLYANTRDEPIAGEKFFVLDYGPSRINTPPHNATFSHSYLKSKLEAHYLTNSIIHFGSADLAALSRFQPSPGLAINNSDISLLAIYPSNVKSTTPIDDPMFRAHQIVHISGNRTLYNSDSAAGVIACATQYEYCTQGTSKEAPVCSGLVAATSDPVALLPQAPNRVQNTTLKLFGAATSMVDSTMGASLTDMLDANRYIEQEILPSLPIDQWKREATNMEKFVWAAIQVFVAKHVEGYAESANGLLSFPSSEEQRQLCHNQKVLKPGGFANVNLFGLAFILSMTILLTALDYGVLRILVFFHGKDSNMFPKVRHWIEDGVYQLQRVAYDSNSALQWARADKEMPVLAGQRHLVQDLSSHCQINQATATRNIALAAAILPFKDAALQPKCSASSTIGA